MPIDPTDQIDNSLGFSQQLDRQRIFQAQRGSTFGEGVGAAFDLARMDTAVMSWARISSLNDLNKTGKKEDPNELNQMFPGLRQPFTESMSLGAAFEVDRRQRDRMKLQQKIATGPQNGFYKTTTFGAALTAHMMDPLEIGSGFVADGLFVAGLFGKSAQAIFQAQRLTSVGRFTRGALSGLAGNIAVEPFIYSAAQQDLTDYNLYDSFISVTGGAIGFPLGREILRFGLGRVGRFFSKLSPEHQDMAHRAATAHLSQDKRVDINPLIEQTVRETDGKLNADFPSTINRRYDFNQVTNDVQVSERAYYGASKRATNDVQTAELNQIDSDFGDGVYFTDNPNVANGAAANSFGKSPGAIFGVRFKPLKLFDLETPLIRRDRDLFEKTLGEDQLVKQAQTGREMFDAAESLIQQGKLDASRITDLNNLLDELEFDGYRYVTQDVLDISKDPHNGLMLFNKSKIEASEQFKADTKSVPRPDKTTTQRVIDERTSQVSDLDFDKTGLDEVTEIKETAFEPLETAKLDEDTQLLRAEVDSLREQGLLTPDLERQAKELDVLERKGELDDEATKNAISCIGKL